MVMFRVDTFPSFVNQTIINQNKKNLHILFLPKINSENFPFTVTLFLYKTDYLSFQNVTFFLIRIFL